MAGRPPPAQPRAPVVPSPLQRAHAPTGLPVASQVAPPAFGIPTCPSLAAKRIQKEWEDLVGRGALGAIPHCLRIDRLGEDGFRWVATFGRRAARADGPPDEGLRLEIEFPRNYPFSAPHVTCRQFALFVPRFVPDWTPRMTVKTLLTAVLAKLEHVSFPANHVDLARNGPNEVSFDALGLSCINEAVSKVVLLCAKPLERSERAYWTVTVHQCTEMEVGVASLWDGHNLIQYVWSYLEVGVIQQLLLPEGSRLPDGRKEKLNSYEYAAEEVFALACDPFGPGDVIAIFYDGPRQSLSFYLNGTLQHTFLNVFCPVDPAAAPPPASNQRQAGSRRGRRERLILSAAAETTDGVGAGADALLNGRKPPARDPPTTHLYPALSLFARLDSATFAFEPPLWSPETHRFYPRAFTAGVPAVLYALEKRRRLSRTLVTSILAWVGAGFQTIVVPTVSHS